MVDPVRKVSPLSEVPQTSAGGRKNLRLLVGETSDGKKYDVARAFFMKNGFEKVGAVKDYWEDGSGSGLDYWESGMDMKLGDDFYDSFVEYQKRILEEFDNMTKEFKFKVLDASKNFEDTNKKLQEGILGILENA